MRHAIVGERTVITAGSCLGAHDTPLTVLGDDVVYTKEAAK